MWSWLIILHVRLNHTTINNPTPPTAGTIVSMNPDGSLAIMYEDGGIESSIPPTNVARQLGAAVKNGDLYPDYTSSPITLERPSGFDARVNSNARAADFSVALVPHKLTRTMDGTTDTLYCRSARKALEFLQLTHNSHLEQSIGSGGPPIKGWNVVRCTQAEFLAID